MHSVSTVFSCAMRRLASTALIVLLAVLGAPSASQAAAPWTMTAGKISVVPGGGERGMPFGLRAPGGGSTRYDLDLVFDITAARDLLTFKLTFHTCTATATTLTCPVNTGGMSSYLMATAKPEAPAGLTVPVPVRAVLDGKTVASATGTVTVAEEVSLAAVEAQDDMAIASGRTYGLAAGVRNTGSRPVTGVVLQLKTVAGIRTNDYANCTNVVTDPDIPPDSGAICLFDAELAPGQEYRLATPWQVTATELVWAPSQWPASFEWSTAQDFTDRGGKLPSGGSGPELELAAVATARAVPQTEPEPIYNNVDEWQLSVTGHNTSTLTVRGDTASGQVGKNVTVGVSVRNNGPARLEGYNQLEGSYSLTTVTLPPGTKVVRADPDCHLFSIDFPTPGGPYPVDAELGDGKYYCWKGSWLTPWNLPGETYTYKFTLRVTKPGTLRGEILTTLHDAWRGNNGLGPIPHRAPIVITATAAPATGGDGGGGGGLPITGSDTNAIALIGMALLVAGAAARLATRRR
jgi:LPXTG-motif cell wall-anchored protein